MTHGGPLHPPDPIEARGGIMKRFTVKRMVAGVAGLALAAALLPAAAAAQTTPKVADQPAATLLLPYFEVDLANPAGPNTLFSVNNASASAALAHVTIWSDVHVPVFSFDVYLTGYDVQTIDLRAVINGQLPATADDLRDPVDTISNQGILSQDITFPNCAGVLPPAPPSQAVIDHLRASLTGQASALHGGQCSGLNRGDQIARGYVTVDSVGQCFVGDPSSPAYFIAGGLGVADNRNILWGDYLYTNHLANAGATDASPLVHIRAGAAGAFVPGDYTFYGRLVGWTAADDREPLNTVFGARYVNTGTATTTLTVWRDPKVKQVPFACGARPTWYPLAESDVTFFNEAEGVEFPEVPVAFPIPPAPVGPFPAGTQRVAVGGAALPTAFTGGWVFLNLNTVVTGQVAGLTEPTLSQAWVSVHHRMNGRYGAGWPALAFFSARATGGGASGPILVP